MRAGLHAAAAVVTPTTAFGEAVQRAYGLGQAPRTVHNGRTPLVVRHGALHDFVFSDNWLRGKTNAHLVLLGYAQGGALFRMLMEERPKELRRYMETLYTRKTGDHDADDFYQAFGKDFNLLELRFGEYVKDIVNRYNKTRR